MGNQTRRGLAATGLALSLLAGATAHAQEAPAGPTLTLAEATELLNAPSPSDVLRGLEALGLLGRPGAVAPISARIGRGLPPELLEIAIDTLSILGRPEAGPVLFRLLHHRRPEVRAAAVRAVAATQPRGASGALVGSLADSDPAVRGAAAEALGQIGGAEAIDALFSAMERHVPEAPTAIGRIARPADVDRFLGYVGRVSFDAITPALSEMLHRDDLAMSARVSIVHRVSELGTDGARQLLSDFVESSTAAEGGAARQAAAEVIPRMGS